MERPELMVVEESNQLRAGRYSRHRPDGDRRRMPDDRMLWKGTPLMRCAHFPTINSFLSNAAEFRRHSRHVFWVPIEYRPPKTGRDGASDFPHQIEGCDQSQGDTPRTPTARGTGVADFKDGFPTELQRLGVTRVRDHP
jgi:hypothetical protein